MERQILVIAESVQRAREWEGPPGFRVATAAAGSHIGRGRNFRPDDRLVFVGDVDERETLMALTPAGLRPEQIIRVP